MSAIASEDLRLIEELQIRYIVALDGKKMPDWLDTFDAEGQYICTTADSEASNLPVAVIMDDCRGRLEDRVKFVDKVWAGTFQDYQTRHFVQRLECKAEGSGLYAVRSHFAVAFTRSDTGHTDIFATGVYRDVVAVKEGKALFKSKTAVIDAPMLPHYMVYPL